MKWANQKLLHGVKWILTPKMRVWDQIVNQSISQMMRLSSLQWEIGGRVSTLSELWKQMVNNILLKKTNGRIEIFEKMIHGKEVSHQYLIVKTRSS